MKQDRDMIESYLSRAEDALKEARKLLLRDPSQVHKIAAALDLIESVSVKMWRLNEGVQNNAKA